MFSLRSRSRVGGDGGGALVCLDIWDASTTRTSTEPVLQVERRRNGRTDGKYGMLQLCARKVFRRFSTVCVPTPLAWSFVLSLYIKSHSSCPRRELEPGRRCAGFRPHVRRLVRFWVDFARARGLGRGCLVSSCSFSHSVQAAARRIFSEKMLLRLSIQRVARGIGRALGQLQLEITFDGDQHTI